MKKTIAGLLLVALAGLTGCASSQVAGTWKLVPGQKAGKVSIARMTLANDGTFLAEAEYGPERQVMDGRYRFANGQLTIMTDDGTREYACSVDGDTMVVSHDGESVKMARMAGCGSACGGCPDGQCKKGGSCPPDCKKPCCANKKTCSADCTKPCCADKK